MLAFLFPQSPGKEPRRTSQTSFEGDHPADTPSPTTPSPTTPMPLPRKVSEEDAPAEEQPSPTMRAPVPLPRHNVPHKEPEELADKLTNEEAVSEASTKTSSSDSGIEDGKSTPTLEEEKVPCGDLNVALIMLVQFRNGRYFIGCDVSSKNVPNIPICHIGIQTIHCTSYYLHCTICSYISNFPSLIQFNEL